MVNIQSISRSHALVTKTASPVPLSPGVVARAVAPAAWPVDTPPDNVRGRTANTQAAVQELLPGAVVRTAAYNSIE